MFYLKEQKCIFSKRFSVTFKGVFPWLKWIKCIFCKKKAKRYVTVDMSESAVSVKTSAGSVGDQNRQFIMLWHDAQVGAITPQLIVTIMEYRVNIYVT